MTDATVKRLALVLAIQAEIEGMKADNLQRDCAGESPAWTGDHFDNAAEDLRNLAAVHDDQL